MVAIFFTQFVQPFFNFFSLPIRLFSEAIGKDQFLANEQELVISAQGGDNQAFSQLYDHYFPRIYGFVYKRCGHQQTAEDITSQAFLKSFAKLDKYQYKNCPFGAWLFRIAANTLTDHFRKSSTKSERTVEEMPDAPDSSASAHDVVLNNEQREKILGVLKKLSKKDEQIIHLRFFAELSVQEVAHTVDMSPNAVSVRIYRALKVLRKHTEELI